MSDVTPADQGDFDYAGALGRVLRRGGWCFTPEGRSASALAFQSAVQQLRTELSAAMPTVREVEKAKHQAKIMFASNENLRKVLIAKDGELSTLRLSNSLLEQFRKSDLEELAALRTQLAASQADVVRLREALIGMVAEYDQQTRYGSPMAKAANPRIQAARAAIAAMPAPDLVARKFAIGDMVRKIKGAQWTGHVVGFYSTSLTPIGYAVESVNEPGSVQIYPEAALERA